MTTGVIFSAESPEVSIFGDIQAWRNILGKWGVDFYIFIDSEEIIPKWTDAQTESYRVNNYEEAMVKLKEVHPECKTTLFTNNTFDLLQGHLHNEHECYIVGGDGHWIDLNTDFKVKLQCGAIWAINCINVALYYRSVRL